MYEDVVGRLQSLGYIVSDTDQWLINFAIEKVTWTIRNECNVSSIPDGLRNIAVDMACGEFLLNKKTSDPGSLTGIDLTAAAKQIQTGDTNIVFAIGEGSSTPEQRLDALITHLMTCGRGQFVTYRRLKW